MLLNVYNKLKFNKGNYGVDGVELKMGWREIMKEIEGKDGETTWREVVDLFSLLFCM